MKKFIVFSKQSLWQFFCEHRKSKQIIIVPAKPVMLLVHYLVHTHVYMFTADKEMKSLQNYIK